MVEYEINFLFLNFAQFHVFLYKKTYMPYRFVFCDYVLINKLKINVVELGEFPQPFMPSLMP